MARIAFLLLTVGLTACSVPPAAAPVANAAQVAQAPGVGGALLTSGSGRPEPVALWQDADIFQLVAKVIASECFICREPRISSRCLPRSLALSFPSSRLAYSLRRGSESVTLV